MVNDSYSTAFSVAKTGRQKSLVAPGRHELAPEGGYFRLYFAERDLHLLPADMNRTTALLSLPLPAHAQDTVADVVCWPQHPVSEQERSLGQHCRSREAPATTAAWGCWLWLHQGWG